MNLSNLSQVLVRNNALLSANKPLLINMPDDELDKVLIENNPGGEITYFDSNFALHCQHKSTSKNHCVFAAYYQAKTLHDLVIIHFPKSKNELSFILAMLAHCTNEESQLLIVGENKSGIKSIEKLIAHQTHYCQKIDSARHCILYSASLSNHHQSFNIEEWFHFYEVNMFEQSFTVAALPGVFSQAKLDVGSKVLLENMHKNMTGRILDFGCGAGVIACYIGLTNKDVALTLADVSALALLSSQKTLEINKLSGETIATNSLSNISNKFHYVISNPPFHQGIKTHYAATETFLAGISKHIEPQGILTIVANSFLRYQPIIEGAIGRTEKLCIEKGFTIYSAKKT